MLAAADFELAPATLHASAADRPVTSAPLRPRRRFDLVGLRWRAGGATPVVRVRVRRDGREWSDWHRLAPGDSGAHASDPLWTGGTDVVQYRLSHAVRGLRLHFVSAHGRAPALRAAGGAGQPDVVGRSSWAGNGQCTPRQKPLLGEVDVAFVHHTDTATSYSRGDVPAMILAICRYHRNSNGWDDIGYNFLVDRFGRVWEGRAGGVDRAVVGAHTEGFNTESTGIANLGTFDAQRQTSAAIRAMARLIRWKLPLHGTQSYGHTTVISFGGSTNRFPEGAPVKLNRVSGHRDATATDCPGDALYGQLPDLRERIGEVAPAPAERPATLTLDNLPDHARSGHHVHVTGRIEPKRRNVTVHVDRRAGGHWRPFGRTLIGVDGHAFDDKVDVGDAGLYRVYVQWGGDARAGAARSTVYRVNVE